jgi:hypothetical protein
MVLAGGAPIALCLIMRRLVAFLVVCALAAGGQDAEAASRRAVRGPLRVLLSSRTSLAAKEAAARKLGNGPLGTGLVTAVEEAPRNGYIAVLLPLRIGEILGQHAGPEAIPSLISAIRNRSSRHFRFEQRTVADVVAALQIAERHGRLQAVEDEIVAVLAAKQQARPHDAALAKEIIWTLGGSRTELATQKKDRLNSPALRGFLYGLLDHPDAEVRRTAARSLSDRGDNAMILRALRGEGIRRKHQPSVRHALVDFTIFVDRGLRGDRAILSRLKRYKRIGSPALREAADKVVSAEEAERRFEEMMKNPTPEQIESMKKLLEMLK